MCAQGVVMHCTGSDFIKVTTQMKTSEINWEHRKTPKIIWYHPENNWGPLIDDLVQFEEDFNSRTKKSVGWGGDRLCQTSPISRSPDGDKNLEENGGRKKRGRDLSPFPFSPRDNLDNLSPSCILYVPRVVDCLTWSTSPSSTSSWATWTATTMRPSRALVWWSSKSSSPSSSSWDHYEIIEL